MEQDGHGKRFNQGKPRVDLAPAFAQKEYCRVLTAGANKYGASNWRRGMPWSNILASLERHLLAIKSGEDYDLETGLLHSAHIMCNAAFLSEYYKIYPQGDDRLHSYLRKHRIGLDIDNILSNYTEHHNTYSKNIKIDDLKENKEFWITIPVKINPCEIPFKPVCYVRSHDVPQEWTDEWLKVNEFTTAAVYTIGFNQSKIDIIKNAKIDVFIDDTYENFVEINNAGICCYLFDTTYNKKYNVGHKRIYSLKDLV